MSTAVEFVRDAAKRIHRDDYAGMADWIAAFCIEYARMHAKEALTSASKTRTKGIYNKKQTFQRTKEDEQIILSAYPIENIK